MSEDKKTEVTRLFYKGKAPIHGRTRDSSKQESEQTDFVCLPNKPYQFDADTGAYIKRLYGPLFISADDFQKQFDAPTKAAPVVVAAPVVDEAEIDRRVVEALIGAGMSEQEAIEHVAKQKEKSAAKDPEPANKPEAPSGLTGVMQRITGVPKA